MSNVKQGTPRGDVTPLILRWALAGVIGLAGWGHLTTTQAPIETPDASIETVSDAVTPGTRVPLEKVSLPLLGDVAPPRVSALASDAQVAVDGKGVAMNFGWGAVAGFGELIFAAVLFIGLFTRWTALAGVVIAQATFLCARGFFGEGSLAARIAEIYHANPQGVWLFGAISLALLISGSGPIGVDRLRAKREERLASSEALPV